MSQLIGVLLGGILALVGSFVVHWLRSWRESRSLAKGLCSGNQRVAVARQAPRVPRGHETVDSSLENDLLMIHS